MTDTKKQRTLGEPQMKSKGRAEGAKVPRPRKGRKGASAQTDAVEEATAQARKTTSVTHVESSEQLVVGGEPRARLLPPEVGAERRAKVIRNRLGLGVVAVVVLVVLGTAAASLAAITAQAGLMMEQARTQSLLSQELKFVKVRTVQDQVGLVKAAQRVGASTEVNWKQYLQAVQKTLPSNVTISTVNVDSATPLALYPQPTASLQGARVGTLTFTAKSPTLPEVPTWLNALATLPGYADALPGSVTRDATTGIYTVNITMHINENAFDKRFTKAGK